MSPACALPAFVIANAARVATVRRTPHSGVPRHRRESPKGSDAFAAMIVHVDLLA
jgi:hypothetical protein